MKAHARIEIIDDEEDLCFLLKLGLSKNFESIEYRHTLKEGLILFNEFDPKWLILDNNLPDAIGWEHIGKFTAINKDINIICISANPDSVIDKDMSNTYHFIKPVDVGEITELILSKETVKVN